MTDARATDRQSSVEMRWVPVVDARGRTTMEARWVDPAEVSVGRADSAA